MNCFKLASCKEYEAFVEEDKILYVDNETDLILDEKKDIRIIKLTDQDLINLKRISKLKPTTTEDVSSILTENFNNKVNIKLKKLNKELSKIEKEANEIQWFKSLRKTKTKLEAIIDYLRYHNNKSLEIDLIYIKAKIEDGEIPNIELSHCPTSVFGDDKYEGHCETEEYETAEPKCNECWVKFLELEKDYDIFRKK